MSYHFFETGPAQIRLRTASEPAQNRGAVPWTDRTGPLDRTVLTRSDFIRIQAYELYYLHGFHPLSISQPYFSTCNFPQNSINTTSCYHEVFQDISPVWFLPLAICHLSFCFLPLRPKVVSYSSVNNFSSPFS